MKHEPDLAARIRRADQIRDAIARKPKFPPGDEHLVAARNLDRILERAKRVEGFDIHRVLRNKSVNLAGNEHTDSTKRLWDYTYPPGASDKRRARVLSKPGKYFEIARAVAAELGEPEAVLVSQVFEGCSLGTEELPEGDWDSENWTRLAELLKQMAAGVIRDHNVEEYWRKLRATNGRFDVRTGAFHNGSLPLGFQFDGWGIAGDLVWWDEVPPVPSIPLGRRLQHQSVPGRLWLEGCDPANVDFLLWLDLRLALAPVNDHLSIGPLLEFRSNLEAQMKDGRTIQFDNPFSDGSAVIQLAFIGGEEHAVHGHEIDHSAFPDEPEYRAGTGHYSFGWREPSPALLSALLDPSDFDQKGVFIPTRRHESLNWHSLPPSRFGRTSAAGAISIDLLTGALEAELGAECDRLAAGLDALRAEQDRAIRDAEAEAMARWATKTATNPDVKREDQ